jgi:hypothetical protein
LTALQRANTELTNAHGHRCSSLSWLVSLVVLRTLPILSPFSAFTTVRAISQITFACSNSLRPPDEIKPFAYQWLMVMSTQLIGFSIGGIARRFLVAPPSMIWPSNLVQCALFNTLHSQVYEGVGGRGGMSRERFFACMSPCALY